MKYIRWLTVFNLINFIFFILGIINIITMLKVPDGILSEDGIFNSHVVACDSVAGSSVGKWAWLVLI